MVHVGGVITSQRSRKATRLKFQDESPTLDTMANKFKLIYHPIVYIHVPRYVTVCQLRNLARAQICINLLQLHKRGVHIPWGCSQSL